MMSERFSPERALAPLRPFQRRTVDYVMQRLYEDPDPVRQFLVADEVGLGKTMVASGVIARAIEHLWDKVRRIDIVYICSNAAIAQQNVRRLNVLGAAAATLPTRITLLPLQFAGAQNLSLNRVNFISLTPGTSFDLKSSTGTGRERTLILRGLKEFGHTPGLREMMRVGVKPENWDRRCAEIASAEADETLLDTFHERLVADQTLMTELVDLAALYADGAAAVPEGTGYRRNRLVAQLRGQLAQVCVSALEPDLVIQIGRASCRERV